MILFEKQAAVKTFYFLMAVDGAVTTEEIERFDLIGKEIDPENFQKYREKVISECEEQIKTVIDDEDYYEVVLEGVDKAMLYQTAEVVDGIAVRHIVWDMLVIAFCNAEYSKFERKLIKHIVRVVGLDIDVFLEMEQAMKTYVAVEKELAWIKTSSRPYVEIRPIVDELEKRIQGIKESARNLVEDEYYTSIEKIELPANSLYVNTIEIVEKIGDDVSATASDIGKKTKNFFSGLKPNKNAKETSREAENKEEDEK